MGKARSARGEVVDFDLLKIKQQIASQPSVEVKKEENFLDKRLRKKLKQAAKAQEVVPTVEDATIDIEQPQE